jgi:7-cyano-7-deazaguanine synthase
MEGDERQLSMSAIKQSQTVVLLSGGLDSTVLLYHLKAAGDIALTLSVNYNQRHVRELNAAAIIAGLTGSAHQTADLSAITPLLAGSALTSASIAVPLGHYEDESMKQTVVPNRNMILLSVATAWAISTKSDSVAYAAHSGDHAIYPDCRTEFADAMEKAIGLCDWSSVSLVRPFVNWTKSEIVRRGYELNVPFVETWSCYKGLELQCGKCGTCVERREAFALANVQDPTIYEDDSPA